MKYEKKNCRQYIGRRWQRIGTWTRTVSYLNFILRFFFPCLRFSPFNTSEGSKHFNCFYATVLKHTISSFIWMPSLFWFVFFLFCCFAASFENVKMCVIKCFGAGALCGNKLINSQLTAHTPHEVSRLMRRSIKKAKVSSRSRKVITNWLPRVFPL